MKFRKKPVIVEAVEYREDDEESTLWECFNFCKGAGIGRDLHGNPYLVISTLEGAMKASRGDWIVKGIAGEFYPVKPDIFEKTYERVEDV